MNGHSIVVAMAIILLMGACKKDEPEVDTSEHGVWTWETQEFLHPIENDGKVLGLYSHNDIWFMYWTETSNGTITHNISTFDGQNWNKILTEADNGGQKHFFSDTDRNNITSLFMVDYETNGSLTISTVSETGIQTYKTGNYPTQDYTFIPCHYYESGNIDIVTSFRKESTGVTSLIVERQFDGTSNTWIATDSMVGSLNNPIARNVQVIPGSYHYYVILSDIIDSTLYHIYKYNIAADSLYFYREHQDISGITRFFKLQKSPYYMTGNYTNANKYRSIQRFTEFVPSLTPYFYANLYNPDEDYLEIQDRGNGVLYTLGNISPSPNGLGTRKKLQKIISFMYPGSYGDYADNYGITLDEASHIATQELGYDFLGEGNVYEGAFYFKTNQWEMYAVGNAHRSEDSSNSAATKIYMVKYIP